MSHAIVFDTLAYANKFKKAGFTERQAETLAETQAELIEERLVSREHFDLKIKELELATKRDIKELELKISGQLLLLKWMLGLISAGIVSLVLKAFFIP